jgi:hypothetical protein
MVVGVHRGMGLRIGNKLVVPVVVVVVVVVVLLVVVRLQ